MLNDIKVLLGIASDNTDRDNLLKLLISTATARLQLLLGGIEPPESMEHIIREVAVIRFNRIGSEGMASHTVEGESLSFEGDDFAQFADEIQAFLDSQQESKRGRVRFL
jgi:hypothetical protein